MKKEEKRQPPPYEPPLMARAPKNELEREAQEVERAVYGKPLIVHMEPSIGTEDTPARTDELLPIHPGGITKQGDEEAVGQEGPPHLPKVIPIEDEEQER